MELIFKNKTILDELILTAFEAAHIVRQNYTRNINVAHKDDGTVLTETDLLSEKHIISKIEKLTPSLPILAEEKNAQGKQVDLSGGTFWCVDPLDGTEGFVKKTGEFSINIGLIHLGKPIYGLIASPLEEKLWVGYNNEVWRITPDQRVKLLPPAKKEKKIALTSPRHNDELLAFLAREGINECLKIGGALKFPALAEGKGTIYPRFNRSYEWDTAAGHAILKALGGNIVTLDGKELSYMKEDFCNPSFIAHINT